MVQGNPFDPQTTNMAGAPLVDQKGQPKVQYFFAVAFPKNALAGTLIAQTGERIALPSILEKCQELAAAAWPAGAFRSPTFAWKILDGDQPSADGGTREGFAGCWVFRFSSGYPIHVVDENLQVITDPAALRRGYFVRVLFQYAGNGQSMKPGMYCNAYMVQRVAFGPEIVSGPSAADAFSAPVGSLPAGASTMPPAPPASPGVPSGPSAAPASGFPPGPALTAPPAAAPAVLAPAPDFLQPSPPAPPEAPAAPQQAVMMTAKAAGAPMEAFLAKGWTLDTLIAQGYAVRG
jgi:hypothetical protein